MLLYPYYLTKTTIMIRFTSFIFAAIIVLSSCTNANNCPAVTTDPTANKAQFLGDWYEIGSIPQFFNIGCNCTKATYTDNGTNILVTNSCRLGGATIGVPNVINGTAFAPNPSDFSKLKVQFPTAPVAADYWIIYFDPNGQNMLIGDPNKTSLFVLSRTRTMSTATYNSILARAIPFCYNINKVKKTDQISCNN
jgi:apolipoprotein D and lipocalin family protein